MSNDPKQHREIIAATLTSGILSSGETGLGKGTEGEYARLAVRLYDKIVTELSAPRNF